LRRFGVDLARVRSELEKIVSRSPPVEVRGNLPFTPRAKVALEFAVAEARLLGHPYVGTEHLLLGLIREGEGIAVLVLQRIGVARAEARTEILEFLGAPENESTARTRERLELLGAKVRSDDPAAIPALTFRKSSLRIGVVGANSIGVNAHLPAYVKWGFTVT